MNPIRVACLLLLSLVSLPAGRDAFAAAAVAGGTRYPDERFDFALIGDTPYDAVQETNYFPNLVAELNRARIKFVVHNGDFKAGATPCTDELFERRARQFQAIRPPFVFLFGDNEWSDCGAVKTNAFDPLDRLEKLRALFTAGDLSLGQRPMRLERQSADPAFARFRENVRWVRGRVVFAGLNVPGSENNFGTAEYGPRNAANLAWIRDAFALARREQLRAVMFILQANPHFDLPATNRVRRGFNDMLALLERETIAFGKPVVFVHGDSHIFRIDQPLFGTRSKRRIENFTRVETYGNPDVHWIQVSVDWRDPEVFTFRPRHIRANFIRH